MKKKAGIVFSVLLVLTLLLLTPTVAMAATGTQDGIDVELTTDKSTYAAGDTAAVTVTVTNTNSFAVDNIQVALTLPDGLKLKSGDTNVTVGTLLAGESRQLHLTATVPQENIPNVPQTGDDTSALLWIVVLLISLGGIAALLIFRKKIFSAKIFSLFLCFVLVLSVMSPVAFAATTEKSFSVNETVAVAGVNKTITAKVTYDWNEPTPPNPPVPTTYSVTMQNDGNGTASANPSSAAAGTQITITATPNNGYQFKQWVVVSGGATLSSTTTNPATFPMPAGNVTIKAEFEPVVVPPTPITFTAAQTGGTSNTTDSTGIELTFSQPVTGLTAGNITIADDTGAAVKGALSGSGTTWTIALTSVTAQGNVTVSVADFGNFDVTTTSQSVAVYMSNAVANAEAAKITGFTAGTNNTNNLVFNPTITGGSLVTGATVNLVEVKTGADASSSIALNGSGINGADGVLSLNTNNTVDASDLTYVGVTFTVTLNGVTSDPVTLDISSLFGAGTTASKLRTDKAKIPTNGSVIGDFTFTTVTTNLDTYYSLTPAVTLSSGVAFSPVAGFIQGGGLTTNPNQLTLKADAGGDIQIAFAVAPNATGNCRWQSDFVLTCEGTSYTCTGVDFLVMIFVM